MEIDSSITKQLEQIGLKPKEAEVYLALLSLESSTAYEIAQHCDVKKPTVYVILEDLRQKGLVLKVPHAKKALYAAKNLGEYLAEQRGKLSAVEALVPRLMSLKSGGRPNVYFFNGLKGFAEAMDFKFETLRGSTLRCFYSNAADAPESIQALYRKWTPAAVNKGVSFEIVMPEVTLENFSTFSSLAQEQKQIGVRHIAGYEHASHLSIEIAESFVRIYDAKRITATIIDDKATADMMRAIFEIVWAIGSK